MTPARQAAQHAWLDYVAQMNERFEPRDGWGCIEQLPRLGLPDLGLCLRAHPDLLDDVAPNAIALADSLATGEFGTVREDLAASILTQLSQAVRRRLLSDLIAHAEQVEIDAATASAERMGMTHAQFAEAIRGTEQVR